MQHQILRAIELINCGRRDDALWLLRDAVEKDPALTAAWKWLAYTSPDPREALQAARRVEALAPDDPWLNKALPVLSARAGGAPTKPAASHRLAGGKLPMPVSIAVGAMLVLLVGLTVMQWLHNTPRTGVGTIVADQEPMAAPIQEEPASDGGQVDGTDPRTAALAAEPGENVERVQADVPSVDPHSDTRTYTFVASTEEEVRQALYNDGPQLQDGSQTIALTSYQMWVEWKARQAVTSCQLTRASVHLDVNYTLPQWVPTGSPPDSLYEAWDRFNAHVIAHEEYHGELAQECADRLAERLREAQPHATCGDLERWINSEVDEVYAYCEQIQSAYDEVEGRTSFPLPAER